MKRTLGAMESQLLAYAQMRQLNLTANQRVTRFLPPIQLPAFDLRVIQPAAGVRRRSQGGAALLGFFAVNRFPQPARSCPAARS